MNKEFFEALALLEKEKGVPVDYLLEKIKAAGMKAGLSLRPRFSADTLESYADICDLFLIMTVEPGFGGQKFMSEVLDKVRNIRAHKDGKDIDIQMDGGINAETAALAANAGVNILVAGSAVFANPPYEDTIRTILKNAEDAVNG